MFEPGQLGYEKLVLVRRAMTSQSKRERSELLDGHDDAKTYFLECWCKGNVCGQCQYFTQLGGLGSGLSGVCGVQATTDYLMAERSGCNGFQKRVQ